MSYSARAWSLWATCLRRRTLSIEEKKTSIKGSHIRGHTRTGKDAHLARSHGERGSRVEVCGHDDPN